VTAFRPVSPFVLYDPPVIPVFDYVKWSSAASIIIICITAIAVVLLLAAFAVMLLYRNASVVRYANGTFVLAVVLGLLLGLATIFTYIGNLTEAQCALRPWFGGLGYALVFGFLVSKLWRLSRILNNTALLSAAMPASELVIYAGGIVAVEVILLIVWTAAGRLQPVIRPGSQTLHDIVICTHHSSLWIFVGIQIAYCFALLAMGIFFSIRVRTIARKVMYKEPLWISYSLYITVFWALLFLLVSIFLWNNYVGAFITASIAILGMILSVLALLFGSKIYVLFFTKDGRESGATSTVAGSDFSTDFRPDEFNAPNEM